MPRRLDLFPDLLSKDWWHSTNYPRQLKNQKFATVLGDEDLQNSSVREYKGFKTRPRAPASAKASGISAVKIDKDGFQVTLDVDDFELEELCVEKTDQFIEVHGKHEDKRDQYGLVSREFTRRYMLPYDCNIQDITSCFSDGKLIINVPKGNKEPIVPKPVMIRLEDKRFQKSEVEPVANKST